MPTITDLVVHFGDLIQLKDQHFELDSIKQTLAASTSWKPYNPRKDVNRFGLSVTSLDGKYSGVPDLDSLREYNQINGTRYTEQSFKRRTPIATELNLNPFLDLWGADLGRSHFLRIDQGGFFPPHRDNGLTLPPTTARILVPISWQRNHAVWIQDGQVLDLQEGQAYFVNTTKEHSIFSYVDGSILLVLNVNITDSSLLTIASNAKIL